MYMFILAFLNKNLVVLLVDRSQNFLKSSEFSYYLTIEVLKFIQKMEFCCYLPLSPTLYQSYRQTFDKPFSFLLNPLLILLIR